jgi:hypothetical protein
MLAWQCQSRIGLPAASAERLRDGVDHLRNTHYGLPLLADFVAEVG